MKAISVSATLPDKNIFIVLLLGLLGAELLIIMASLSFPLEVLVVIAGAFFLYLIVQNTFIGLCVFILMHFFVIQGSKDISPSEFFFALCFFTLLGTWFFRKIFLERQKILQDGLDYALAGFLALCALSIIPAYLLGSSLLKWLRELLPFLALLLIFPIREQVDSPRRIKIVIACFLLLSLTLAIGNILSYKQAIFRAVQVWEIAASRQAASPGFLLACVVPAGAFFVCAESKARRWLALLLMAIFGIALVVSFSRGFWVAAIVGFMTIFWLVPKPYKWRMITYFSLCILIAIGIIFQFFGDLAAFIIDAVKHRFFTVGRAVEDLSFANRLVEARAVIEQIKTNPIIGYGLGKTFYYKALIPAELPTWYVHNTVLFVWYKIGIFGLSCLVIFLGGILWQAFQAYKAETDLFLKTLLLGMAANLIAFILVSFSSPQLLNKESALIHVLMFGLIQSIRRRQINDHRSARD